MVKALGLELAGTELNANLKAYGSEYHQSLLNLHGVWRCFPEGRTFIDNSSSRTEEVILGL